MKNIDMEFRYNVYDMDLEDGDEDYLVEEKLTLEKLRDHIEYIQYDNYVDDVMEDDNDDAERQRLEGEFKELLESSSLGHLQCIIQGVGYFITEIRPGEDEEHYPEITEDVLAFFKARNAALED